MALSKGLLGLSFGLALAGVSAATAAPAGSRASFAAATHNGTVHQGASIPSASVGFNYFNVSFCADYNPSSGTGPTFLFVYGQQGSYIFTDKAANELLLTPACVTGNLVAVNVIDSSGNWDSVYVYNHP